MPDSLRSKSATLLQAIAITTTLAIVSGTLPLQPTVTLPQSSAHLVSPR